MLVLVFVLVLVLVLDFDFDFDLDSDLVIPSPDTCLPDRPPSCHRHPPYPSQPRVLASLRETRSDGSWGKHTAT